MQRPGSDRLRPGTFEANFLMRKVENPKDTRTQAIYDFLYIAQEKIQALNASPTSNEVGFALGLLMAGVTKRRDKKAPVPKPEEHSEYFASYFRYIPLRQVADTDVNPVTLKAYKELGMCISVNGYAVWFAEDQGQLCLYFGKEPIQWA